jgi:DNA-binding CsgD family transcriptional regulator
MNFGRTQNYFEVRGCFEAVIGPMHERLRFINRPTRASVVTKGEAEMRESSIRLGPREQQIAELLLQGCDNSEIARQLKIARRTVKAHFNRLFLRFAITGGIKRVKLATILYRRQLCWENNVMETEHPVRESDRSSNLSPKGSRTVKSRTPSGRLNMSSRTTCESSMTSSDSGTGSSLRSGTKLAGATSPPTPEVLESWEHSILSLDQSGPRRNLYR